MTRGGVVRPHDAVPVAERLRVLQWLRVAGIALVLLCAGLAPGVLAPGRDPAVATTLLYAVPVLGTEVLSRLSPRRLVPVFGGMLLVDGLWLGWIGYLTGGLDSPLRHLVLLHIAAVALVASYRTGLKLALWHSLLLCALDNGVRSGVLTATGRDGAAAPGDRLVVFVVVVWLVAISTSTLSAVNERELRRQRLDLEALTALAEQLERTTDSAAVARTLLDSTVDAFGFTRGVVVGGPDGQLGLLASVGVADPDSRRPGRPGASAAIASAHEQRAAVLTAALDPDADPWLSRLLPEAGNLVVVPLSAEGRPLGALVLEHGSRVGRPGGRLERRVLAGLERSASYAALALRNAWLLEQLRRLASTDGLTKIANRRTFESSLEREIARAARSAEPLSLVMLDIDHFKRLNDEQGHQAGDEVLRNVAAALSCECRDFDTPARYGGEEFAVVLPGCGPEEAGVIAERLRRAVASAPSVVPITASAGVASYPAHAGDADSLVRAADTALYRSKNGGRDRTTCSDGVPEQDGPHELLQRAVARRLADADALRASTGDDPGTPAGPAPVRVVPQEPVVPAPRT